MLIEMVKEHLEFNGQQHKQLLASFQELEIEICKFTEYKGFYFRRIKNGFYLDYETRSHYYAILIASIDFPGRLVLTSWNGKSTKEVEAVFCAASRDIMEGARNLICDRLNQLYCFTMEKR